ncbi:unnamed protein product [Peronospora belbahrii]|uniref:Uncharacterized protein n=1 Tax=Peronospora belbahrii TaxID=622444 RepID=A0AAU9KW78_9STRA|nr:unnamed protein product [Peronospora belbahrii]
MACAYNIKFYYYIAFDCKWRVATDDKEVEADFGMFHENRVMKSNFQQVTTGCREPRATRNVGTNLVLSEKEGGLFMSSKSNNTLVRLDVT